MFIRPGSVSALECKLLICLNICLASLVGLQLTDVQLKILCMYGQLIVEMKAAFLAVSQAAIHCEKMKFVFEYTTGYVCDLRSVTLPATYGHHYELTKKCL